MAERILLETLVVDIVAGYNKFVTGMNAVQYAMSKVTNTATRTVFSIKGLVAVLTGGAAVMGLRHAINSAAEYGVSLRDMSRRTGIGVRSLSILSHQARLNGADIGSVSMAIRFMSRTMQSAINGRDGATEGFKKLGLNVNDLMKLKPETAFLKVGNALMHVKNQYQRTALAQTVFSRGAAVVLPMFADGMQGWIDAASTAATLTEKDAEAAGAYNDSLTNLSAAFMKVKLELMKAFAPAMTQYIMKGANTVSTFVEKFKKYGEIIKNTYAQGKYGPQLISTMISNSPLKAFKGTFNILRDMFPQQKGIINFFNHLANEIVNVFRWAWKIVKHLWSALLDGIRGDWTAMKNDLITAWETMKAPLLRIAQEIGEIMGGAIQQGIVKKLEGSTAGRGALAFLNPGETASGAWDWAKELVGIPSKASEFRKPLYPDKSRPLPTIGPAPSSPSNITFNVSGAQDTNAIVQEIIRRLQLLGFLNGNPASILSVAGLGSRNASISAPSSRAARISRG